MVMENIYNVMCGITELLAGMESLAVSRCK
uniref:Uncharacterized protein n=1 Tax=Anguilla anguilla TaxID=7936 RepID=A0A0E9VTQ4_ANGAN